MERKREVGDLAVFGGRRAFDEPLHVGRPNIGDRARLHARFDEILDRRWLTNDGPCVRQFEKHVAELSAVDHCIAVCNGTIALEIAIRALKLEGEVIVPSFTFVATAHALQWQEITPVFCDVDAGTLCIDPARIEESITPRTTGIIGMHAFGRPCDVDAISDIAKRRGLRVLYDAAHAFCCGRNGTTVGGFGDAEVVSFHATKFVNTFEGGVILTRDAELARRARLMRNFGFAGTDEVVHVGTNGKMNEFSAAMGMTSLESIDSIVSANKRNREEYERVLARIPGVALVDLGSDGPRNYQYVVLRVDERIAGLSRDHLVEVLNSENVLARRYFYPGCHRMEPYRSYFPHAGLLLPVTERLCSELVTLPTGATLSTDEVSVIGSIIEVTMSCADRVAGRVNLPGPATPRTI